MRQHIINAKTAIAIEATIVALFLKDFMSGLNCSCRYVFEIRTQCLIVEVEYETGMTFSFGRYHFHFYINRCYEIEMSNDWLLCDFGIYVKNRS